ncbi:MAG: zinc metalloprotease [Colwellia sp.]|nr:zinc metalloprotease [Colwellia sp.]
MSYKINNKEFGSVGEFVLQGRGCATITPNHYQIKRNDELVSGLRRTNSRPSSIIIPIKFIHIVDGSNGHITQAQREAQMSVLREAYGIYGINFEYSESEVVVEENSQWYRMDHGSFEEREAKTALQENPKKYLNFYTAGLASGLLGWATFPWEREGDFTKDGVVMLDSTLPGGDIQNFNLGKTAIHEIGHWLGLFHTFQGGCQAYGDHVHDTPPHAAPNYGKPEDGPHNACSVDTGNAPIHNFMNYVDDAWMTKFTQGQIERVWDQISLYRSEFLS